jgi:transcriptional regulator with XRE-family HTH domain
MSEHATLDMPYFATQLRQLRRIHNLTQEDLSLMSGLSTRTIEKLESGRHGLAEQSLRSLCRALKIDRSYFVKPSEEAAERQKAAMLKALRTTAVVRTTVLRTARDLMNAVDGFHAWNIDLECVGDQALDLATGFAQNVTDWGEIWSDIGLPERLEACRGLADDCAALEAAGYLVHAGSYRARRRFLEGPPLVFRVGLMSVRTKADSEQQEVALVQMSDGWELPADEVPKFDA